MSDTDKATEVESEDKKGDCLTPSATIVALFVLVGWFVVKVVVG